MRENVISADILVIGGGLAGFGKFKSIVTRTFPLDDANEALALLRDRKIMGRASIIP